LGSTSLVAFTITGTAVVLAISWGVAAGAASRRLPGSLITGRFMMLLSMDVNAANKPSGQRKAVVGYPLDQTSLRDIESGLRRLVGALSHVQNEIVPRNLLGALPHGLPVRSEGPCRFNQTPGITMDGESTAAREKIRAECLAAEEDFLKFQSIRLAAGTRPDLQEFARNAVDGARANDGVNIWARR
jgi:hypothetical protein